MEVKLLVVQGRPQRKSLVFRHGSYLFGRGDECHIRPNSEWVSRQHCELFVRRDAAFIKDLGSRNGTLVNGERVVGERGLTHGDHLQIGPLVFEVRLEQTSSSSEELPVLQAESGHEPCEPVSAIDAMAMTRPREDIGL